MAPRTEAPKISNDAVLAKTGKSWAEWFALLDAAGAAKLDHKGIVALTAANGAGPWWQQGITVEYERARGLRAKYQLPDGFAASITRTVGGTARDVVEALSSPTLRKKLVGAGATVKGALGLRNLKLQFKDGSLADVAFLEKAKGRIQIAVQHRKLKAAEDVARAKELWAGAIGRLEEVFAGKAEPSRPKSSVRSRAKPGATPASSRKKAPTRARRAPGSSRK
jgi:hypothetical protein